MNLDEFRGSIPAAERVAYLNTGSSSPSSVAVVDAMEAFLERHGYDSPTDEGMYAPVYDAFEETRRAVAAFLNAASGEIALTQSTGDGVSRVANAIEWRPGDTIVRLDLEHPANVVPWDAVERDHDVTVETVETSGGHVDVDAVTEAVDSARLVCLSSVSRTYGTRIPVEAITDVAHDAGAEVLVDAVQSVGQEPVDVTEWGADYVAAAGHKWLVGPWGAGFLYVSSDVVPDLQPSHASYRSVDRDTPGLPLHPDARCLEIGTTSAAPYVGLQTALERLSSVGVRTVQRRIESLTGILRDELPESTLLSPRSFESGIVAVDDERAKRSVERLAAHDVVVRSITDPDGVRVSVHGFNTEADVRRFLSAYRNLR